MPITRRENLTFPISVRRLTVSRILDLGPGLRRITLTGDQLGAFRTDDGIDVPALRNDGFDDHVKLIVPGPDQDAPVPPVQRVGHLDWDPPAGRPTAKDYTPRRFDPVAGELDLEFVRHGDGPAATWAENARVGDPAYIAGPKSSALLPRGVDHLVVAGDETALPAIGRLLADLPPDTPADVLIEVADARHEVPLPGHPSARVRWVHREGPPGTGDTLLRALRELPWPTGTVYAWVAGETLTLKPIRSLLKNERGVPRDCLEVTGYWRRRATPTPAVTTADTPSLATATPPEAVAAVDDDDAHERLHALADLTGPYAVRAAVTIGLLEALDGREADAATLAATTDTDEGALRALLRYLASVDVLTVTDAPEAAGAVSARYGLGPIGQEVVEDDHSAAEYHLDGPQAALDTSVAHLVGALRTGRAARDASGSTLAQRLADDPRAAADQWRLTLDEDRWPAASIASALDWSQAGDLVAVGAGSAQATAAILRRFPSVTATLVDLPSLTDAVREFVAGDDYADRLRFVASPALAPPDAGGALVLAVGALQRLPDDDAAAALGALLRCGAGRLAVVEQLADDEDDDLAGPDLVARCAFGVGLRSLPELLALAATAGADVLEHRDVGWGRRLLLLR